MVSPSLTNRSAGGTGDRHRRIGPTGFSCGSVSFSASSAPITIGHSGQRSFNRRIAANVIAVPVRNQQCGRRKLARFNRLNHQVWLKAGIDDDAIVSMLKPCYERIFSERSRDDRQNFGFHICHRCSNVSDRRNMLKGAGQFNSDRGDCAERVRERLPNRFR